MERISLSYPELKNLGQHRLVNLTYLQNDILQPFLILVNEVANDVVNRRTHLLHRRRHQSSDAEEGPARDAI